VRTVRAWNATRNVELGNRVAVADTHWTRLRGMLGRAEPEVGEGLLLRPCRAVHMYGMRFPLDVAFLTDDGRVVGLYPRLEPSRRSRVHKDAGAALELPAGRLVATGTEIGDEIRFATDVG
jgi:uncharacterized membrane protein (UPF0127 family)